MPKISKERLEARIKVLGHAESWIYDQINGEASSDIFLDANDETPELISEEALNFCKKLRLQIRKLQSKIDS